MMEEQQFAAHQQSKLQLMMGGPIGVAGARGAPGAQGYVGNISNKQCATYTNAAGLRR